MAPRLARHDRHVPQSHAAVLFAGGAHAPDQLGEYVDLVHRTRDLWAGRIDVRLGLECDYFPGYEEWLERQLQSADFEYVLGSVHPQVAEYRRRFWQGDVAAFSVPTSNNWPAPRRQVCLTASPIPI